MGLADSGRQDRIPPWTTADAQKRWARNPGRVTTVYDYTLVVRAQALLGGAPDAALRERKVSESPVSVLLRAEGVGKSYVLRGRRVWTVSTSP